MGALPGPIGEKHFAGELEEDFDTVLGWVDMKPVQSAPIPVQIAMRLAEPVLGAMPDQVKASWKMRWAIRWPSRGRARPRST